MAGASQTVVVSRNTFDDISGGALKIGNINDTRAISKNVSDFDKNYEITDNIISNIACEYRGAAAIFAGYRLN